MKKLFLVLAPFLISYASASDLTESDIKKAAQATVDCYNDKFVASNYLFEDNTKIGGISFENKDVMVVYRGAKGLGELWGCINYGDTEVHAGFQSSYNKFSTNVIEYISEYSELKSIDLEALSYHVVGHSRGTGFVPQTVDSLLELGIPAQQIRAISFSPFKVYSPEKANLYNITFGNNYHIGFKSEEDTFISEMEKLLVRPNLGKIIEYKATTYDTFNKWVESNPYLYFENSFSMMKAFIPAIKWGAHLAEGYLLTAPEEYENSKK